MEDLTITSNQIHLKKGGSNYIYSQLFRSLVDGICAINQKPIA